MASCIQIRSLQQAYLDDELTSGEKLQFEEHIRGCAACKSELQHARTVAARLFEVLGRDRLYDDLTPSIMAHLPYRNTTKYSLPVGPRKASGIKKKKITFMGKAATLIPVFVPLLLLVLAALLWISWPASLSKEAKATGVVTLSQGAAQSGHISGDSFQRIRSKDILVRGTLLKTGPNGRLLFGLLGPTQATLYRDSILQVVNEREVVLEQGRMFIDVNGGPRMFSVDTPHGTVTVMGTSFQVDTKPSETEVTVVRGQVLVENDTSFALLTGGSKGVFHKGDIPRVHHNVPAKRCLEEARSVLPDMGAERYFQSHFAALPATAATSMPVQKQIFMVETRRRAVSAVKLNWFPDTYPEGHTGYHLYISDSALNPLFKAFIAPEVFRDKSRNSLLVAVPAELQQQAVSMLHITLMPDYRSGQVQTSFTEVSAIGIRQ